MVIFGLFKEINILCDFLEVLFMYFYSKLGFGWRLSSRDFLWPLKVINICIQIYMYVYIYEVKAWIRIMTVFFFFVFCHFLGLHLRHMEVPRIGVKLELQLPAYTIAIATQDPSRVCDLHHSSWQCRILNPLSETRNWTHILMDASRVYYHWATMGTPHLNRFIGTCSLLSCPRIVQREHVHFISSKKSGSGPTLTSGQSKRRGQYFKWSNISLGLFKNIQTKTLIENKLRKSYK